MSKEPFRLFLHIPKTAGTSLRAVAEQQYGVDNVIIYYNQPSRQLLNNLGAMLLMDRRDYRALFGHFEFGIHEDLSREARYITLLRDPVERVASNYFEMRKSYPDMVRNDAGEILELGDAVAAGIPELINLQTRFMTGLKGADADGPAALATAIGNIESHFDIVGLCEAFDESLLLIAKDLGWRPCLYHRLNARREPLAIDDAARETIVAANANDVALYDYASRKFAERLKAEGDPFRASLEEFTGRLGQFQGPQGENWADAEIAEAALPVTARYLAQSA